MLEEQKADPDKGKVLTLPNLMLLWSFIAAATALSGGIKAAGGGVFRYCVGIPISLLVGAVLVYLLWNLWRRLLHKFEAHSNRTQNWIGLSIFAFLVGGICLGY